MGLLWKLEVHGLGGGVTLETVDVFELRCRVWEVGSL